MLGRQYNTVTLYKSIVQRYARIQIVLDRIPFSSAALADVEEDYVNVEVKNEYPKPDPKFADMIKALPREKTKKHAAKQLRKTGRIPSIIFECENGQQGGNKSLISVETKQIRNLLRKMGESFFLSRVYDIEVRAASDSEDVMEKGRVLPRLVHINRATDEIVNVTFIRAPSDAMLKVDIPLLYRGEDACTGIRKGGRPLADCEIQIRRWFKTDAGLLDLEIGDALQFTLDDYAGRPRVAYARLVQCRRRSPMVLESYLHKLLCVCDDNPGKVVREITKCPLGFLLALELRQPTQGLVCRVLVLADVLRQEGAALYGARVKQIFKFFSSTEFLRSPGALNEYLLDRCREEDEEEGLLIHNFMLCLVAQCPESVTNLLPLIESMMEIVKRENLGQSRFCDYVVELLRCHARVYSSGSEIAAKKLPWDKLPLVPVSAEITDSKSLPFVKKKGGYGSVDEYLDTYYTLLREDCSFI